MIPVAVLQLGYFYTPSLPSPLVHRPSIGNITSRSGCTCRGDTETRTTPLPSPLTTYLSETGLYVAPAITIFMTQFSSLCVLYSLLQLPAFRIAECSRSPFQVW